MAAVRFDSDIDNPSCAIPYPAHLKGGRKVKRVFYLFAVVLFAACESVSPRGLDPPDTSLHESYNVDTYVEVWGHGMRGSGFFVNEDGLLLTAQHVIANRQYNDYAHIRVWWSSGFIPAKVIAEDEDADIALLKVNMVSSPIAPLCTGRPPDGYTTSYGRPRGPLLTYIGDIDYYIDQKGISEVLVNSTSKRGMSGGALVYSGGLKDCTLGILVKMTTDETKIFAVLIESAPVVKAYLKEFAPGFIQ